LDAAGVLGALVTGAVVLEDLSASRVQEAVLFHLLNLARVEGAFLLVTSSWRLDRGYALPDLASRLREIPTVEVGSPDDALLAAVLVKLFADRQVVIDHDVVSYLLPRMERSFAAASALVGRLDAAALSRGRAVTRPLAAEVLRAG
jgi:chromosomal replication initiation ATPase DnaA